MNEELSEEQKRKIKEEEEYRSQVRQKFVDKPKYYAPVTRSNQSGCSGCLKYVLIFFIVSVVIGAIMSAANPQGKLDTSNGIKQSADFISPTENTTDKGIGVSRSAVIRGLTPHGFSFRKDAVAATQGKTEFVGERGKNKFAKVFLRGPEDNLTQVSIWVDSIGAPDGRELVKETLSKPLSNKEKEELNTGLLKVPIFVGIIDKTAATWIEGQMVDASNNPLSFDMPKPDSKTTKVFGGNLFEFIYFPVGLIVNVLPVQ